MYSTIAQQQMLLVGTWRIYHTEEFSLKQIDFNVEDVGKFVLFMCERGRKFPMSPPQLLPNCGGSQLLGVDPIAWASGVQGQS